MIAIFDRKEEAFPPSIRSVEELEAVRIVRFRGPVDITTVSEIEHFQQKFIHKKDFQYKHLLLDFKEVTHTDSVAVADILKLVNELKHAHHELGIVNVDDNFYHMIQIMKINHWIVFYANEAEAIKKLSKVV